MRRRQPLTAIAARLLAVFSMLHAAGCSSTQSIITTDDEEIDPEEIMDIDVVVEKCAVPDLKTYFEFDSDEIGKSENLDKLAQCLTAGPLRDSLILLVGHTDRIGSKSYNEKLGLARARKVAAYLIERGVGEKRIKYLSQGKTRSSGNPRKFRSDRRVDISLLL
jgi:hypothetical protein